MDIKEYFKKLDKKVDSLSYKLFETPKEKGVNNMDDIVEIKTKHVITLSQRKIEEAIEEIIDCQIKLMEELNTTEVSTERECQLRLKAIEQRNLTDALLRTFGIQSFQYFNTDYRIEIR